MPNSVDVNITVSILFTFAPIALVLHVTIIYIITFSSKRHKYKNTFYTLVVCLSCTDIYWSIYHIYQGFCHTLEYCPFGELGNILISGGAQLTFFLCMNMDLLIAFNRFSAIVLTHNHEKVFSQKMGIIYCLMFLGGSAIECVPTWIYMKKYYVDLQTWTYVNIPPENIERLITWFEVTCTYLAHSILAILYVWSFIVYRKRIKSVVKTTTAQKREGRLLIQAVFSGIPCFTIMTFHHLIPIPLMELLGADWCLLNGPLVYLWFNKEIRADFLELICLRTGENVYLRTFVKKVSGQLSAVNDRFMEIRSENSETRNGDESPVIWL